MKKLIVALIACLSLGGFATETNAYAQTSQNVMQVTYGCSIVADDYGEREVCNTSYYVSPTVGVIYWDPYYHIWSGGGVYYQGNVWHHGYYPGYWGHYHSFYRNHGYYNGYKNGYYHGNRSSHFGGHGHR